MHGLDVKQGFNDEISAATLVSSDRNVVAVILETLDDLSLENLVTIPIEELQEPFHITYLGYNKKSFHSHLVEEFIKFTQKHIKFPAGVVPLEEYYMNNKESWMAYLYKGVLRPFRSCFWLWDGFLFMGRIEARRVAKRRVDPPCAFLSCFAGLLSVLS